MLPDIPASWSSPITGVIGLAGVALGALINAWLTDRREQRKARLEFVTKQLDEFYGPLYAKRLEIRTLSVLRDDLDKLAAEISARRMKGIQPLSDTWEKASDAESDKMQAQTNENNRIFQEVLLPTYKSMIETYRDKMWLADHRARDYFRDLVTYVHIWERAINKTAPVEAQQRLKATEDSLEPFYQHIEQQLQALQDELGGSK